MRKFIVKRFYGIRRQQSNTLMFISKYLMQIAIVGIVLTHHLAFVAIGLVAMALWVFSHIFETRWYASFRCGPYIYWTIILLGLSLINSSTFPAESLSQLPWHSWVLIGVLLIEIWIAFKFWTIGYFGLWPAKWEELDDEQKYDYGLTRTNGTIWDDKMQSEWHLIAAKLLSK